MENLLRLEGREGRTFFPPFFMARVSTEVVKPVRPNFSLCAPPNSTSNKTHTACHLPTEVETHGMLILTHATDEGREIWDAMRQVSTWCPWGFKLTHTQQWNYFICEIVIRPGRKFHSYFKDTPVFKSWTWIGYHCLSFVVFLTLS